MPALGKIGTGGFKRNVDTFGSRLVDRYGAANARELFTQQAWDALGPQTRKVMENPQARFEFIQQGFIVTPQAFASILNMERFNIPPESPQCFKHLESPLSMFVQFPNNLIAKTEHGSIEDTFRQLYGPFPRGKWGRELCPLNAFDKVKVLDDAEAKRISSSVLAALGSAIDAQYEGVTTKTMAELREGAVNWDGGKGDRNDYVRQHTPFVFGKIAPTPPLPPKLIEVTTRAQEIGVGCRRLVPAIFDDAACQEDLPTSRCPSVSPSNARLPIVASRPRFAASFDRRRKNGTFAVISALPQSYQEYFLRFYGAAVGACKSDPLGAAIKAFDALRTQGRDDTVKASIHKSSTAPKTYTIVLPDSIDAETHAKAAKAAGVPANSVSVPDPIEHKTLLERGAEKRTKQLRESANVIGKTVEEFQRIREEFNDALGQLGITGVGSAQSEDTKSELKQRVKELEEKIEQGQSAEQKQLETLQSLAKQLKKQQPGGESKQVAQDVQAQVEKLVNAAQSTDGDGGGQTVERVTKVIKERPVATGGILLGLLTLLGGR